MAGIWCSMYSKMVTVLLCIFWIKVCSGRLDPVYSEYMVMVQTSQGGIPMTTPEQIVMMMAQPKSVSGSPESPPNLAVMVPVMPNGSPVKAPSQTPAVPQPITEPFTPRLG